MFLLQAANHVLGSVLCCPGCFSVYRAEALRHVVPTYASSVTKASEFLTKDMGEDRWLCTLLVRSLVLFSHGPQARSQDFLQGLGSCMLVMEVPALGTSEDRV